MLVTAPPVTIPNASHKFKCNTRKTKISVTHGTGYTPDTLKPCNLLYKDFKEKESIDENKRNC